MGFDKPPQTIAEALECGWTHLEFECRSKRCRHLGRIALTPYDTRHGFKDMTLCDVFDRCVCGACGLRPVTGALAVALRFHGLESWHTKRVDFFEGMVIRPTRE